MIHDKTKKILTIIATLLALQSCGYKEKTAQEIREAEKRIVPVWSDLDREFEILLDKESGVEYFLYTGGYGSSMCPLYNPDGTLKTNKNYTR